MLHVWTIIIDECYMSLGLKAHVPKGKKNTTLIRKMERFTIHDHNIFSASNHILYAFIHNCEMIT